MARNLARLVASRAAVLVWLPLVLGAARAPAQHGVPPSVTRLYAIHGDTLLWQRDGRLLPVATSAIRLLAGAADQGLDPAQYDARLLDSLARTRSGTPEERRRLDLLLSAAMVRYLAHLSGGRAAGDPPAAVVIALREAIAADALPSLATALEPRLAQYRLLREALARYRLLMRDTAIAAYPAREAIHPGGRYQAVNRLARHLRAVGDLAPELPLPVGDTYDEPIVGAVRRFQQRHGLAPDGVLGPATFAALNTPVRWRVRQLELAMERLRRLPPLHGDRLLVVNVPAFRLFAFDSAGAAGQPAFASRVVVGRAITRTPVLFGHLRLVEFWPYWNVPRSILLKEILPALERRPDHLRRNRMEVVDRRGTVVGDRATAATLEGLRRGTHRVRQRPGPGNALGLVKFVFPNAADVYIHATPHPDLFERPRRDLSHGCIRVEDFRGLATWVLAGSNGWTADSTAAALGAGRTRRVPLSDSLQVAVFYTTAVAGADGRVHFHEDLYELDSRLDAELRGGSHLL